MPHHKSPIAYRNLVAMYMSAAIQLPRTMIWIPIFLLFTLGIAYSMYEILKRRHASLPPGPITIPLLGNMYSLIGRKRPNYEIITELSKTHGDIMTLRVFNKPVVFLSSMQAVKETYGDNKEISDRPASTVATITGGFGLQDFTAKTQVIRNAFMQSIRSFWSSPPAEGEFIRTVDEVIEAMISIGRETNKPILMDEYIIKMVYNTIILLEFGKRFALDDPVFLRLICEGERTARDLLRGIQICDVKLFLRNLLRLDHLTARFKKINENEKTNKSYKSNFQRLYEDINTRACKEDEIESVAHGLIKRLKDTADKTVSGDGPSELGVQIGDQDIVNTLCGMFFAATASTIVSLKWLLLEMVLHPEIQGKCYQELMEVTNGRPVTQSDRSRLPYIEACIMESLRFHPPSAFNLPHISHSDISIRNYKIPAGVVVLINFWAAHHEENLVKDAKHFSPENFLDEKGQFFRPKNLFPFGAGRRMCPGEAQAKLGMFFAFTTMLGRVRFERVENCEYDTAPDPSELPTLVPKKYYVNIRERKSRSANV